MIAAIWVAIWGAIFHHKVIALRALATGCAVNAAWLVLWNRFLDLGLPATPPLSTESFACLFAIFFTQTVTGWVVARTHRAHAIPMVFGFGIWLVVWYPGYAELPRLGMLLADSIDQRRLRPDIAGYLAWIFVPILSQLTGLLVGGILGAAPKRPLSPSLT